jgi:hypothetical protein
MSVPADTSDVDFAALSNRELTTLLREAESAEREVSDRRQQLHDQIDGMRSEPGDSPELAAELAALAQRERALSTRRLELHQQITEFRLEKNRRLNGLRAPLRAIDA